MPNPTAPNGPSERDLREAALTAWGEDVFNQTDRAFAAALWQRWQREQPDLDAVKREAARDALTRLVEHFQVTQHPVYVINIEVFRDREYPAVPPVREPRVTEAEYRAARKAVEAIHGPDYPVPLADILYAAARVRLAADAGGTDV